MKENIADILRQAMRLPPEARAALAGSLLDSLDEPMDRDAESAWEAEIASRIRHLSKANLNFCQFQASLVISPVIKKAEAESFCPAPATMILRDSFRKGDKFQNQIISGSSPLFV